MYPVKTIFLQFEFIQSPKTSQHFYKGVGKKGRKKTKNKINLTRFKLIFKK